MFVAASTLTGLLPKRPLCWTKGFGALLSRVFNQGKRSRGARYIVREKKSGLELLAEWQSICARCEMPAGLTSRVWDILTKLIYTYPQCGRRLSVMLSKGSP